MHGLILDLDGTLVDTVYAHVFAWQRALGEFGSPVDGWRIHRRIGMSGGLFARAVAREIGRAAAVKASSPALQHKSDAGALVLGVTGESAVRAAYRRVVAAAPGAHVLVEAMAPPGVEVIVAVRRDVVVPAVVVGLGGIWTELLDDIAIVPLPATPERVEAALRSLRGAGLLAGARGSAGIDVRALAALAAACGDLALRESLALFELNPVIASASGAVAVDAAARANGRH